MSRAYPVAGAPYRIPPRHHHSQRQLGNQFVTPKIEIDTEAVPHHEMGRKLVPVDPTQRRKQPTTRKRPSSRQFKVKRHR